MRAFRLTSLILLFIFSTLTTAELSQNLENKYLTYKDLNHLNKEESKATAIYIDHDRLVRINPPQNDFLSYEDKTELLFNTCLESSTMLVFTQDLDDLLSKCDSAFNAGAADAYFLVGNHFLNAEWIAPDFIKAVDYLNQAAQAGSREAKRELIDYYTNPKMPMQDSYRANTLAQEISKSGYLWDEYRYATLISIDSNKDLALQGYNTLLKLAQKGYPNATAKAALARVLDGPLNDMEVARELFDIPQDAYHLDLTHAKLVFLITDNNLEGTRDLLEDCYQTSYLCSFMYYHFLQKGIGGDSEVGKANDVLNFISDNTNLDAKMFYAWYKATAKEKNIFNPIEARKVISALPSYKKEIPFYKDTLAAIYAANDNFEKAVELQLEVVEQTRDKGFGDNFIDFNTRLELYKKNKRWISDSSADSYIKRFKEIQNISNIGGEIAAL